jgi:hypothetical protein
MTNGPTPTALPVHREATVTARIKSATAPRTTTTPAPRIGSNRTGHPPTARARSATDPKHRIAAKQIDTAKKIGTARRIGTAGHRRSAVT